MGAIRSATEAFIRLAKREVHENAVLVAADDVFEVTRTPSVILQGPMIKENGSRRSQARLVEKIPANFSFEECKAPRLYHLDFNVIVTTDSEGDLLDFQEKVARLYQTHPVIEIGSEGSLNLTELMPLGGLRRINLSNLRQASGLVRIEDCPVYTGEVTLGKLIRDRIFSFDDGIQQELRTLPASEGEQE